MNIEQESMKKLKIGDNIDLTSFEVGTQKDFQEIDIDKIYQEIDIDKIYDYKKAYHYLFNDIGLSAEETINYLNMNASKILKIMKKNKEYNSYITDNLTTKEIYDLYKTFKRFY